MKKILFTVMACVVGLFSGNVFGQNGNIAVRVDPDDWSQVIVTQNLGKQDSILYHFWAKQNGDKLARVSWQRNQKVNANFSFTYGAGLQVIKNRLGADTQVFTTVVPKITKGKVTVSSAVNLNISFKRPILVKNISQINFKVNEKLTLGYRGELSFNKKFVLENRQGGQMIYKINKDWSAEAWIYGNGKSNKFGLTFGVTRFF